MAFKETPGEFKLINIAQITPDPAAPRKYNDPAALKSLAKSIQSKGLIQPLVVHPADAEGKHKLIVGERRWRAAQLAGETVLPALIKSCTAHECLEIQVFENLGLGVRTALEPREMAKAIKSITQNFESREAAAEHFGRNATWLNQATAAANLSPKVNALLESGKISSTTTALQLERLAQKNEAKADVLIEHIENLPEGEKLPRTMVEHALSEAGIRRTKKRTAETPAPAPAAFPARKVHPGKIRQVAEILGLEGGNEEEILERLIDEFLAMKSEENAPF